MQALFSLCWCKDKHCWELRITFTNYCYLWLIGMSILSTIWENYRKLWIELHFLSKVGCTIILAKCGFGLGLTLKLPSASSPPDQCRQMVPHNLQQNAAVLTPNVLWHIFRAIFNHFRHRISFFVLTGNCARLVWLGSIWTSLHRWSSKASSVSSFTPTSTT